MGIPYSLFGYNVNLKRIWTSTSDGATNSIDEDQPPVRKKLKTADYIFERLFVGGEGSDVLIKALDCEWKLHRVYLAQSSYFASMFSGNWKESRCDEIAVKFPDHRITADSLTTVFGSLYKDCIDIDVAKVVSLVATASALQLENVVLQCGEVMISNISVKTIHIYYRASKDYGLKDVESRCFQWLEQNVLYFSGNRQFLRKVKCSLMADLVKSPKLHVVQGEMDLYCLLRKWIYLRCCPTAGEGADDEVKKAAHAFFTAHWNGNTSFLESSRGRPFLSVFRNLRVQHLVTSLKSFEALLADNIIPKDVIEHTMAAQWRQQLAINFEGEATIGQPNTDLDEDSFYKRAMRCGRVLLDDTASCWRWTGYFFGVDLLLSYKNRVFSVRRNCNTQPSPAPVSLKPERKICYRLSVLRFNEKRQKTWSFDTGVKCSMLKLEEAIVAARIPSGIPFPITIIFYFVTVPNVADCVQSALSNSWAPESRTVDSSSWSDEEESEGEHEVGVEAESSRPPAEVYSADSVASSSS